MKKIIKLTENDLEKIVIESAKCAINEVYQNEGLSDIMMHIKNGFEKDNGPDKTISDYLIQALSFLEHGNTEMARSEIYNALRLAEKNKKRS